MLRAGGGTCLGRMLLSHVASGARSRLWASVLGLSLDQLTVWGVLYYAYNVLSAPLARDLGVSRTFVAGAFSLTLLGSGLLARPVGRSLDRWGARPVLLVGAVVGPLAFGALALAHGKLSLLLAFAALGLAHALTLYEPAFRAIVDWFPAERECGRALLVLTSIGGFASTAFLPLTAWLVEAHGFRSAIGMLAVLALGVSLPVRLALSPRARASAPAAAAHAPRPSSVANALGTGFAIQSFASTGATLCLVWHLVERGETLEVAAFVTGVAGGSQVLGRLLLASLQRAMTTAHRLPLLFLVQACALAVIAVSSGVSLVVAIVVFGAASGTMTLERATVTREWFGREAFGARSGHIASIAFLARAASPYGVELLRAETSYAGTFAVLALGLAVGAIVMTFAARARRLAIA